MRVALGHGFLVSIDVSQYTPYEGVVSMDFYNPFAVHL